MVEITRFLFSTLQVSIKIAPVFSLRVLLIFSTCKIVPHQITIYIYIIINRSSIYT
jgi:hypothetical protein